MRTLLIVALGAVAGIVLALVRTTRSEGGDSNAPRVNEAHGQRLAPQLPQRIGQARVAQRDLVPADPRYNPVSLLKESSGELTPKEIFASEPRDPVMAPVFEQRAKDSISGALEELKLSEKVKAIKTECKTLSCETRLEVSAGDMAAVYDELNGVMLGDVQAPNFVQDGDVGYVSFTNLYRPEAREEVNHQRFLDEAYRPSIEAVKQRLHSAP